MSSDILVRVIAATVFVAVAAVLAVRRKKTA